MRRVLLAGTVALGTIACSSDDGSDAGREVEADGLAVLDAWTRPTPPGVADTAIYFTVESRGAPPDRWIGGRSDHCLVITPHLTSTDERDVTAMDEATGDQLAVAAGRPLVLAPGGLHLMCQGLDGPLNIGDEFDVELLFAQHAPITVTVATESRS